MGYKVSSWRQLRRFEEFYVSRLPIFIYLRRSMFRG